jgi:uncharacterized phage-associated protein
MNASTYNKKLVYTILKYFGEKGVSKVMLAKTIYFCHKELVKLKVAELNDLKFIRMPLGPVPIFINEIPSYDFVTKITRPTTLSYNKELYLLKEDCIKTDYTIYLKRILDILSSYSTSQLVEMSHKDYSWIAHKNADEYYITEVDLKPITITNHLDQYRDNIVLQSLLVKGMIKDIVADSTALEYPSNNSNGKSTN